MTRALLRYTVLRLTLFAALFALFAVLGIVWWLAATLAAVAALALSYIFLRRYREAVTAGLHERLTGSVPPARGEDEDAEDRAAQAREQ